MKIKRSRVSFSNYKKKEKKKSQIPGGPWIRAISFSRPSLIALNCASLTGKYMASSCCLTKFSVKVSKFQNEVIISPKIWTKYCKDFFYVLCHNTGQKFLQFLIHLLRHSEIYWPVGLSQVLNNVSPNGNFFIVVMAWITCL